MALNESWTWVRERVSEPGKKTEPPDNQILAAGVDHQSTETALNPQTSSMLSVPPRSRQQQSRRKIEYVPVAREVDTYGGRDFKAIESEWANLPQRRPNVHSLQIIDRVVICFDHVDVAIDHAGPDPWFGFSYLSMCRFDGRNS